MAVRSWLMHDGVSLTFTDVIKRYRVEAAAARDGQESKEWVIN